MTTIKALDYVKSRAAGTAEDPFPGQAIVDALLALPQPGGGTVIVGNGIWLFDQELHINGVNNFILQGESYNAELRFVGEARPNSGQLWFGSDGGGTAGFTNGIFENFYINASGTDQEGHSAFRFSNGHDSEWRNVKMLGHKNGSIPAMFWEGGQNNKIHHSEFDGRSPAGQGDSCCQIQSGAGSGADLGTNFEISDNVFWECSPVIIGINNAKVLRNQLKSTFGFIGIAACGTWNTECESVIIDGNTVDASSANGVHISGLPNDPGGMSVIRNFQITNNVLKGTFAAIHCQSFDANNYNDNTLAGNEKYNVLIKGNTLHSEWGGSGINCKGGAGKVDGVLVENNVLTNDAGQPNGLDKDANTFNLTVRGNTGIPNDDGTEPPDIEEPPPDIEEPPPDIEEPPPEQTMNTVTVTVNADPPNSVRFQITGATAQATPGSVKQDPKGKPQKPPGQPPLVTIDVRSDPADSSIIKIEGNAVSRR